MIRIPMVGDADLTANNHERKHSIDDNSVGSCSLASALKDEYAKDNDASSSQSSSAKRNLPTIALITMIVVSTFFVTFLAFTNNEDGRSTSISKQPQSPHSKRELLLRKKKSNDYNSGLTLSYKIANMVLVDIPDTEPTNVPTDIPAEETIDSKEEGSEEERNQLIDNKKAAAAVVAGLVIVNSDIDLKQNRDKNLTVSGSLGSRCLFNASCDGGLICIRRICAEDTKTTRRDRSDAPSDSPSTNGDNDSTSSRFKLGRGDDDTIAEETNVNDDSPRLKIGRSDDDDDYTDDASLVLKLVNRRREVPLPTKSLLEVCSPSYLRANSTTDCQRGCTSPNANCCGLDLVLNDSDESCFSENRVACALYAPCSFLALGFDGDRSTEYDDDGQEEEYVNSDVTIVSSAVSVLDLPPVKHLAEVCAPPYLQSNGTRECEALCIGEEQSCCDPSLLITSPEESCFEDKKAICAGYLLCLPLMFARETERNVPVTDDDASVILQQESYGHISLSDFGKVPLPRINIVQACDPRTMSVNGTSQCRSGCNVPEAACCGLELLIRKSDESCFEDNKVICSLYAPCSLLQFSGSPSDTRGVDDEVEREGDSVDALQGFPLVQELTKVCKRDYMKVNGTSQCEFLCMGKDDCCDASLLASNPDASCFQDQPLICGAYLVCSTLRSSASVDLIDKFTEANSFSASAQIQPSEYYGEDYSNYDYYDGNDIVGIYDEAVISTHTMTRTPPLPPINLLNTCAPSYLLLNGTEECSAVCSVPEAACCGLGLFVSGSEESCFDDHLLICSLYAPCSVLQFGVFSTDHGEYHDDGYNDDDTYQDTLPEDDDDAALPQSKEKDMSRVNGKVGTMFSNLLSFPPILKLKSVCDTSYLRSNGTNECQDACVKRDPCCHPIKLLTDPDGSCFRDRPVVCGGYLFCTPLSFLQDDEDFRDEDGNRAQGLPDENGRNEIVLNMDMPVPRVNLLQVCSPSFLLNNGTSACREGCAPQASCCRLDLMMTGSSESCYDDYTFLCALYAPCAILQFGGIGMATVEGGKEQVDSGLQIVNTVSSPPIQRLRTVCHPSYLRSNGTLACENACIMREPCCDPILLTTNPHQSCFHDRPMECGGYLFCTPLTMISSNDMSSAQESSLLLDNDSYFNDLDITVEDQQQAATPSVSMQIFGKPPIPRVNLLKVCNPRYLLVNGTSECEYGCNIPEAACCGLGLLATDSPESCFDDHTAICGLYVPCSFLQFGVDPLERQRDTDDNVSLAEDETQVAIARLRSFPPILRLSNVCKTDYLRSNGTSECEDACIMRDDCCHPRYLLSTSNEDKSCFRERPLICGGYLFCTPLSFTRLDGGEKDVEGSGVIEDFENDGAVAIVEEQGDTGNKWPLPLPPLLTITEVCSPSYMRGNGTYECEEICDANEDVACCNPLLLVTNAASSCYAENKVTCTLYLPCLSLMLLPSSDETAGYTVGKNSITTQDDLVLSEKLKLECQETYLQTYGTDECESDWNSYEELTMNAISTLPIAPATLSEMCDHDYISSFGPGDCEEHCITASCCDPTLLFEKQEITNGNDSRTSCFSKNLMSCPTYFPCLTLKVDADMVANHNNNRGDGVFLVNNRDRDEEDTGDEAIQDKMSTHYRPINKRDDGDGKEKKLSKENKDGEGFGKTAGTKLGLIKGDDRTKEIKDSMQTKPPEMYDPVIHEMNMITNEKEREEVEEDASRTSPPQKEEVGDTISLFRVPRKKRNPTI